MNTPTMLYAASPEKWSFHSTEGGGYSAPSFWIFWICPWYLCTICTRRKVKPTKKQWILRQDFLLTDVGGHGPKALVNVWLQALNWFYSRDLLVIVHCSLAVLLNIVSHSYVLLIYTVGCSSWWSKCWQNKCSGDDCTSENFSQVSGPSHLSIARN